MFFSAHLLAQVYALHCTRIINIQEERCVCVCRGLCALAAGIRIQQIISISSRGRKGGVAPSTKHRVFSLCCHACDDASSNKKGSLWRPFYQVHARVEAAPRGATEIAPSRPPPSATPETSQAAPHTHTHNCTLSLCHAGRRRKDMFVCLAPFPLSPRAYSKWEIMQERQNYTRARTRQGWKNEWVYFLSVFISNFEFLLMKLKI